MFYLISTYKLQGLSLACKILALIAALFVTLLGQGDGPPTSLPMLVVIAVTEVVWMHSLTMRWCGIALCENPANIDVMQYVCWCCIDICSWLHQKIFGCQIAEQMCHNQYKDCGMPGIQKIHLVKPVWQCSNNWLAYYVELLVWKASAFDCHWFCEEQVRQRGNLLH